MTLAVMFPGQGSQHEHMREAVAADAPDLLEAACDLLGDDPFDRLADGTSFVQPAIFCASIASWRREADELRPAFMAGHSLGEIAALAAAGALDEHDALRLVVARGRTTEAAAREIGGGMMALKCGIEEANELAADAGVFVANDNAPRQVVVTGPDDALDALAEAAGERRVRALRLQVDGAFHAPTMAGAREELARHMTGLTVRAPRVPVFSATTAAPFEDVRRELLDALVSPVRWREVVLALSALGVDEFVEAAPGKVLTGIAGRVLPGVAARRLDPFQAPANA